MTNFRFSSSFFYDKNELNSSDFFSSKKIKLEEQLSSMTIFRIVLFEAHYLLNLGPIFDGSEHKFGNRYEDNLIVIFYQWLKLYTHAHL